MRLRRLRTYIPQIKQYERRKSRHNLNNAVNKDYDALQASAKNYSRMHIVPITSRNQKAKVNSWKRSSHNHIYIFDYGY